MDGSSSGPHTAGHHFISNLWVESASGATLLGRCPVLPGKAVAVSVIPAMLFVWWLRPLSKAVRVGEQTAVLWNAL